jgi:hypothetical protein
MLTDVMSGNQSISTNLANQLQPWTQNASAAAGGAWSAINQKAGLFGPAIAGGTNAVTGTLWAALNPWSSAASSSANGILGAFGGTSGQMSGIGESIVDGLVNGIKRKAASAFAAAANVASGLLGTVNKILNVNSPSKAFRDGPGVAIPEGLAAGIDMHQHFATNAAKRMTSAVMTAGTPSPAASAYAGANAAVAGMASANSSSSSSAQPVVINVMADFGEGVKQVTQVQLDNLVSGLVAGVTTGTGNRR